MEKGLKRRCTLQPCHLQNILGDAGQCRHKQYHVIAQILPQEQYHNNDDGVLGFHPVDLVGTKHPENIIDSTVVVKQYLPDQHDGRYRNHHGAQEKGSELTPEGKLCLQHNRQEQGKHHSQRHRYGRKSSSISDRPFERFILYYHLKIVQKHKLTVDGIVYEGIIDNHHKGEDKKHKNTDKAGRKKQP